jgi:hypothetical protein
MTEEHRTFESGAIRDSEEGKEDYTETISWTAMKRYAQFMTKNKEKYGAGNFKMGMPIDAYERSLIRHLQKYMENKYERGQTEVEGDHLSAMLFNIFGIIHEEEMAIKQEAIDKEVAITLEEIRQDLEKAREFLELPEINICLTTGEFNEDILYSI